MRALILCTILALGLPLAAGAAEPQKAAPQKAAPPAAHASPSVGKAQQCAAAWRARKVHRGARAGFMKACIAKG